MSFNIATLSITQQLEYGLPVAGLIIIIVAFIFWRKSKKAQNAKPGQPGAKPGMVVNEALIVSPSASLIVGRTTFTIERETDRIQNIEATYAKFPEDISKKGGFNNVIQGFKKMFRMNNEEDEAKKGRPFNADQALRKAEGGWFAIFSIETNSQIPITTPEMPLIENVPFKKDEQGNNTQEYDLDDATKYRYVTQIPISTSGEYVKYFKAIDKKTNKEVENPEPIMKREVFIGLMKTYMLEMERNTEKRIANLKAAQNAALDYIKNNRDLQQLGRSFTIGTIAIMIAIMILAIVISTLPGSIHQILIGFEQTLTSLTHAGSLVVSNSTKP